MPVICRYLRTMNSAPIGIFDSGVGGLTVARALSKSLPNESFIYFGDTAHLPYGEKSAEAIQNYSIGIADFLIKQGCKAIVMACNSASSVAFDVLVEKFGQQYPIINVIDPVVKAAGLSGHNVGVIGTRATIESGVYQRKLQMANHATSVHAMATPLLVPVIEEGLEQSAISYSAVTHYLSRPALRGIDELILGCTHYPLLTNVINDFYEGTVHILDAPQIAATEVAQILEKKNLLTSSEKQGDYQFFVSDYTPTFARIAKHFFGVDINLKEQNIWA